MPSIPDNRKTRGRPSTGIGKPVGLRLYPDMEEAIDRFIAEEPDAPTRPEALRRILRDWLIGHGYLELPPPKEDAN